MLYIQENEEEKDEIDEELEDEPVVEGKLPIKKKGASASSIRKWDWKKDIITIVQNMAGLRKLMQEKPSTASIGNWGILEVVFCLFCLNFTITPAPQNHTFCADLFFAICSETKHVVTLNCIGDHSISRVRRAGLLPKMSPVHGKATT